jgi:predicted dehydrogenase
MSKMLTVAIVGAGRIAGGFDRNKLDANPGIFTHAGAYTEDGRFTLKTIIDTDKEKARSFAKEWHVEYAGTDLSTICNTRHDIVSVCTPDQTHASVINALIKARAAKTIFAEKPLALSIKEIQDIRRVADDCNINVVINFQRRFDPAHQRLRDIFAKGRKNLRAVNSYYIKGLDHIGTTLIDTLCYLFGLPESVLAYKRIFNNTIQDYTYEFILFFDSFNVTVKTVDAEDSEYAYHIFEIDILMTDKRMTVNDNSRRMETRILGNYAYSGVKCLNDRNPVVEDTGYALSMLNAAGYVYDITTGARRHDENTPESSYQTKCIVEAIKQSYEEERKIRIGETHG